MDVEKHKCLWCNIEKKKEDLSVIYGKNQFFNKSIFYGCKGSHIDNVKLFLERSEKYFSHSRTSVMTSLVIYPLVFILLKKYFYWITVMLSVDFGSGIIFFPYSSASLTEKIGLRTALFITRLVGAGLVVSGITLAARYFI
ncbi:MAG TPA: hypothetical protein PKY81_03470 [bacterium]|nr:hypothetical protein [bacterium]HPN29995.1 hypothetical protein [bacterium]